MKAIVECFENREAFGPNSPVFWEEEQAAGFNSPLRYVARFVVEVQNLLDARDAAFEIGNAPWQPTDTEGAGWPYNRRSLSSGDVVVVSSASGDDEATAWLCCSFGWAQLDTEIRA